MEDKIIVRSGCSKERYYEDTEQQPVPLSFLTRGFAYEDNGNIGTNSLVGSYDYAYDADRPHAVIGVVSEAGNIPSAQCDVTYNSRNRPATISADGWSLKLSYGSGLQREKTVLKQGNSVKRTTYHISKDCELDILPACTCSRYMDYIFADGKIVAIHVHNTAANADSMYYEPIALALSASEELAGLTLMRPLASFGDRIVDDGRSVVQSSHFDPWGNRKSASDWTVAQDGSGFGFRRGFTGHEHYDRFGIINMNARLYDPIIGRFFSPDPQVQNPYSTQGLNRYSYCGNNPVMNVDPDGEFYIVDAWKIGFIYGFFSSGSNRWRNAWNTANRLAGNDLKILGGLFVTDPNKSFAGRVWEFKTRFNWQLPQTIAGSVMALFTNMSETLFVNGGIKSIEYAYGSTVVSYNVGGWGAITLGNYINGSSGLSADPNTPLFQHEYGHYIQSQKFGLFYLSRYGMPSGLNCWAFLSGERTHNTHPVEQDANIRAFKYFNKHIDSYDGWDFCLHPILNYNKDLLYDNTQNQTTLNDGLIFPTWYNYLLFGEMVVTGFINWHLLENYDD